jgi:hypothetical protein
MRPNIYSDDNYERGNTSGGLGPPYLFFFESISWCRKPCATSAAASAGPTSKLETTLGNTVRFHDLCNSL